MGQEGIKRLFFGMEVHAPWPQEYPGGRLLDEKYRHMTMAFLGNVDYQQVVDLLPKMPKPPFKVGLVGRFNQCLFLPPRHPHVAAWHLEWIDDCQPLIAFHQELRQFFQEHHFAMDARPLLSHVTICRSPFIPKQWLKAFSPLPCMMLQLHLYESIGNLKYESRWEYPIKAAFTEIEHTADIAFIVRGENMQQLWHHAQIALAFRSPQLLSYFPICQEQEIGSIEQIVMALNEGVTRADAEIGSPLKAISFHGKLKQEEDQTLEWEMIVDV